MHITKISERNVMFTQKFKDWDLHLHLIRAENYNYIVDTGMGEESIRPILEYLGTDSKPIRIINTHYHWDHVFGNACFKKNEIISSTKEYEAIQKNWNKLQEQAFEYMDIETEMVLPNVLFNDRLEFPEDGIILFESPGHSEDGISVFDTVDQLLHVGDNIGDNYDFLIPSIETSNKILLDTLNNYKSWKPTVVISGHIGKVEPSILDILIEQIKNME